MSERTWAGMADDDFDEALRGEMAVLQATVAVPRADATALTRSRVRFTLRDPAMPLRLAPAALAVGLSVLIAVGSATWFTVQHLHGRNSAPATTPAPSAVPSPSASPALNSTVPAGVPVFWYAVQNGQPGGAVRLDAVDWNGAHRGHLDLPGIDMAQVGGGNMGIRQSPDGERLLVLSKVYSSDGHHLYDLPQGFGGTWGDDSRSVCWVSSPTVPGAHETDLVVYDGNGTPRPTTSVLGLVSDEFHAVKACSVSTDRVVDYVTVSVNLARVEVRKLGSNQMLLSKSICPTTGDCGYDLDNISVSANGRLAAESDRNGNVRIRDLTTGAVRSLSQRGGVLKMSADGTRLLLGRPSFVYGGPAYPLRLIDVATGRVLWTHAEEYVAGTDAGAQPGGSAMAVAYSPWIITTPPPNGYNPSQTSTLLLLNGGTARTLATGVHSLFF